MILWLGLIEMVFILLGTWNYHSDRIDRAIVSAIYVVWVRLMINHNDKEARSE